MEGLCLPVFKLLQKTPRGKKTTKGNSFFDRLGREGGGVADSLHPPARPPARQLSSGWTARGLTAVPSSTSSFGRLAA